MAFLNIDDLIKGLPVHAQGMEQEQIAKLRLNLLKEDVPFPAAVLFQSAMETNRQRMQSWLSVTGAKLAPHVKTTMSPELMQVQLQDDAWGLTVATSDQLKVAARTSVTRIILANQLVGKQNIRDVNSLLAANPHLTLYIFIESDIGLSTVTEGLTEVSQQVCLLLEAGLEGGRTGVRDVEQGKALAHKIANEAKGYSFAGVAAYEAIGNSQPDNRLARAEKLLDKLRELLQFCIKDSLFANNLTPIVTVGGSDLYDLCVKQFQSPEFLPIINLVLRSGCYLTSDSGYYHSASNAIDQRIQHDNLHLPASKAALQVFGLIQARPEEQLAIVNFGKRDVSYDYSLPKVTGFFHRGKQIENTQTAEYEITGLNDQHAYLSIPANSPLSVGDLVQVGISHPCTTFDKWRQIYVVDDNYNVVDAVRSWF